jgi:hypothetical protein
MEEKRKMAEGSERKNDWAAASRKFPILEANGARHKLDWVCTTSSPPVHEREVFMRSPKDLALEIYQEAYDMSMKGPRRGGQSSWMGGEGGKRRLPV